MTQQPTDDYVSPDQAERNLEWYDLVEQHSRSRILSYGSRSRFR